MGPRSILTSTVSDRALLHFGWAAALRRSELVALEVADLSFEPEGVVLTIRRSKTDHERASATVAVPLGGEEATCPVGALRRWLDAVAVSEGRVFRRIDRHGHLGPALSDRALAEIVAARAATAGLDGDFAGHSLRAGFATAAAIRDGGSEGWALGGCDHAPRALEKRADRPSLYPPGRPLGRQPRG